MEPIVYPVSDEIEFAVASEVLSDMSLVCQVAPDLARGGDPLAYTRDALVSAYSLLRQPCLSLETGVLLSPEAAAEGFRETWHYPATLGSVEFCRRHGGRRGIARQALAFTADGKEIHQFSRDAAGEVSAAPGDASVPDVDRVWSTRGLAQKGGAAERARRPISRRVLLLFDLAHFLGLSTADDIYELHVTVNWMGEDSLALFRSACAQLGVKAIHIELGAGIRASHLITGSFHRGSVESALGEAARVAQSLAGSGFTVTRTKLEAMIRNSLVPTDDLTAGSRPSSNYFEFHVKVAVVDSGSMARLQETCDRHGAHLSRNPSGAIQTGPAFHFATLRAYRLGRASALANFDQFLAALHLGGFSLSNILREYTIYDTNASLDDGWFPSYRSAVCSSACELLGTLECPFVESRAQGAV